MPSEDRTNPNRPPRLASDNWRASVAAVLALVLSLAVTFVTGFVGALAFDLDRADVVGPRTTVLVYFGYWIGYSLLYLLLTWRVFRRADGDQLRAWLQESNSARRARRLREVFTAGSGPAGALFFTAAAVVAVVVVAVSPDLRRDGLVIGLAVGVVAVSWLLLVTVYAIHYAREEVHTRQLEFAGGRTPTLPDYVYLSVQMSTTFSTSDVTVTGTSMRRTATAHAVVAFAFNTVIIALLVSVLVTGVT